MVHSLRIAGQAVRISDKRHSFAISVGEDRVYSYDLEGRLLGAFFGDRNYVRGLSGKLLEKRAIYQDGLKTRLRRELGESEKRTLLDEIHRHVVQIGSQVLDAEEPLSTTVSAHLHELLMRAKSPDQLDADVAHFARIYQPISILPPDQYLSVVLQVTEGCSHNRCTFCNFYRDRRFRIKSDDEVIRHIQEVRDFLGESIRLRKSIFLADANAIVIPQERLRRIFQHVRSAFPTIGDTDRASGLPEPRGVYAFMDMFDGRRKGDTDFAELAEMGLRRVYIGLETGSDRLLRFLKKAGNAQDAVAAVASLKCTGMQVGIILMLGVGGHWFADEHVQASRQVLQAMPLDSGDIIYTSEFVVHPEMEYARQAEEVGLTPLSRHEMLAQRDAILSNLAWPTNSRPRTSNYDIREFIY